MSDSTTLTSLGPVHVSHDATFFIPTARGSICSGNENGPFGIACPRKGDIASANCHSDLWSFNGDRCIAPADAQCLKVSRATWACVFPAQSRFVRLDDDLGAAVPIESSAKLRALNDHGDNDDKDDKLTIAPVVIPIND